MDDYYDRLEAQLVSVVARGAHDRRGLARRRVPRLAPGQFAVALTVLVVLAVGAIFFGVRAHTRAGTNGQGNSGQSAGPGSPASLPPPKGTVVCRTRLRSPAGGGSPSGTARIYEQAPGHYVLWLKASGLKPTSTAFRYAIWLSAGPVGYPAVGVGTAHPTATTNGKLSIEARLPSYASAYHLLLIVRQPTQPSGSHRIPAKPFGKTVLDGSIAF
jgi:hypothetical protein